MRKEFEELIIEESKSILKKALEGQPISMEELEIVKLSTTLANDQPNLRLADLLKNTIPAILGLLGGN